jgi:hypothetical protein
MSADYRRLLGKRALGAGHILIRTVWLGLFLLVCLGGLALYKFALSLPHPAQSVAGPDAAAPLAADEDMPIEGASVASDTLTKSDRLQVTNMQPDMDVKPATVADSSAPLALPAGVAPKFISRHWHDPSDQRAQVAKKPKAKEQKKNMPVADRKPAIEASSCQPNGFEGIRQLFNMRRNCSSTN